jgi:hypothetical protein
MRLEKTIIRSFMIRTAHKIFLGDQIKDNGMGRACGMYGGETKRIQGFSG